MPFFRKVIGKECRKPKEKCELSGVLRDSSEFLCEKCNAELSPVTRTNPLAVLVVVLGALLVLGGAAYLIVGRTGSSGGGGVPDEGSAGPAPATEVQFRYALQMAGDDQPQIVPPSHVFHSGDRFRLLLRSPDKSNALYVFYEDRASGRMQTLYPAPGQSRGLDNSDAGETVSVPPGDGAWIRLDQNPGDERFVVIASVNQLAALPVDPNGCTRDEFDQALKQIGKEQRVREAKSIPGPEWTDESAAGAAVLVARLVVQHQ
jgi:hypothetical protein